MDTILSILKFSGWALLILGLGRIGVGTYFKKKYEGSVSQLIDHMEGFELNFTELIRTGFLFVIISAIILLGIYFK